MSHFLLKTALFSAITFGLAFASFATEPEQKGQNAFTRAAEKPLSGILTPVPNKNIRCNGVVDCRNKGADLSTTWQVNNNRDLGPKDYPERCYVPGDNGKYVFSAAAC